jgi:Integrator complex subunit 2
MFGSCGKKIQLGESEVGLVGIIEVINSSKFETVIVHGLENEVENLVEMLRLEVEIWENFIGQVNSYKETQRKKY